MCDDTPFAGEKKLVRSNQQKLAWLTRNTRPDLSFEVGRLQQRIEKATVQDWMDTNMLIDKAMRGLQTKVVLKAIPLQDLQVIVVSNSSFMNMEGGASQAGFVVLGAGLDVHDRGFGDVSIWGWHSHKLKRKVRSTLSAETMAMCEGTEWGPLPFLLAGDDDGRLPISRLACVFRRCPHDRRYRLQIALRPLDEAGQCPSGRSTVAVGRPGSAGWHVATAQVLAGSLTKNVASRYLPFLMRVGVLHLVKHPDIDWVFLEEKERDKLKRKHYYLENRAKKKARQVESETEAPALDERTGVVKEEAEEVQCQNMALAVFRNSSSGSSLARSVVASLGSSRRSSPVDPGWADVPSRQSLHLGGHDHLRRLQVPCGETECSRWLLLRSGEKKLVQESLDGAGRPWRLCEGSDQHCVHVDLVGPWRNALGSFRRCGHCNVRWCTS